MPFPYPHQTAQESLPLLPAGDHLAAQDRFPLEAHNRPLAEEVFLQPEGVGAATTFWGMVGEEVEHGRW